MAKKTASPTASAWAYRLSYLAGAMFLLNALLSLNFVNQAHSFGDFTPSQGYFNLAESVVFFSVGTIFKAQHRKTS